MAIPTSSPTEISNSTRWTAWTGVAPVEEHLVVCEERRARLAGWGACVRGEAGGDGGLKGLDSMLGRRRARTTVGLVFGELGLSLLSNGPHVDRAPAKLDLLVRFPVAHVELM
jgi:hypothetical protein